MRRLKSNRTGVKADKAMRRQFRIKKVLAPGQAKTNSTHFLDKQNRIRRLHDRVLSVDIAQPAKEDKGGTR
jgi:hypothetical protein